MKNQIVYNGKAYELTQIDTAKFVLAQEAPYDLPHIDTNPDRPTYLGVRNYTYNALRFDGKFFGYKLIDK